VQNVCCDSTAWKGKKRIGGKEDGVGGAPYNDNDNDTGRAVVVYVSLAVVYLPWLLPSA
jgi:hypothetical protein